ncbi:MAG: peptidylprolyl isomerase [Steroidobacteraceae bacterium]|nr:peptidylprolyl isomerase [Steroidobacteraceae bacterium]
MKLNRSAAALWVGSILALLSLATSAAEPERVRVTTNLGAFVVEVQRDRAPLTAENFLGYVKQGYYTNTLFHRVIANFLIQGGGVGPDYKAKPTGKPIANEAGNGLKNLRGTVGLARASGPHSGDVQFYVNVADNADLDPLPTRWGYAVFGRVIEGMEVVDRISISPTGAAGPFKQDSPLAPVVIQKIELLAAAAAPAPAPAASPAQGTPIPEGTNLEEIVEKAPTPAGGAATPAESTPPPK